MPFRFAASLFALTLACGAIAAADENPTIPGKTPPSATEAAFVASIATDLSKRFPMASDAVKAGYVRYTNEDETGAISYANMQWQSADAQHPSQLWYDKDGKLLGADFSQLATDKTRPNVWGIAPGRWYEFDDHIHYVTKDPATGKLGYDKYIFPKDFEKAGGDMKHPDAEILVKMGKVKSTADVATIFDFPSVWDLIVWIRPNASGPFAEKNPAVKP